MKATISVPADTTTQERIISIFSPEDKRLSNGRGFYTVDRTATSVEFTVEANDAVALRALLSSITKVLSINHKITEVVTHEHRTTPTR